MIKALLRICLFLVVVGLSLGSAQIVAASGVAGAGGWEILGQHTVKVGESLYCIGRAYGVDPAAIATQNDVANPSIIHPGDVLSIPDVSKTLPPGPVCTPQFGDIPEPPPRTAPAGAATVAVTHGRPVGQYAELALPLLRHGYMVDCPVQLHPRPQLHPRRRDALYPIASCHRPCAGGPSLLGPPAQGAEAYTFSIGSKSLAYSCSA